MQIGATAEAIPVSGGAGGDAAAETEGAASNDGSFLQAVTSAMGQNQQGEEGEATPEGDLAAEMVAELTLEEAIPETMAELSMIASETIEENGMPSMSFGNPEMTALQNQMLGEIVTDAEVIDPDLAVAAMTEGDSPEWLQGNQPLVDSAGIAAANQALHLTPTMTEAAKGVVPNGTAAASQTALQNATLQVFQGLTGTTDTAPTNVANTTAAAVSTAALTEADLTVLSEQALQGSQTPEGETTSSGSTPRTAAVANSGAAMREALANANLKADSQNAARQASMSTKQINIQSAEASADGDTAGFTGTEGGDTGSSGTGTGTNGGPISSSFQASLQAQAAGKTTVSATNPEGTNLQQAAFAKMPGIPEGARLRVLSTNPATQVATVEVQHPSLGPIQLEVQMQEQELSLKAVTHNMAAAAAIGASEHALRNTINEQGMDLADMTVSVDREGAESNLNQEQWDEHEERAEMLRNSRAERDRAEGPDFSELTAARLNVEA